MIFADYLSLIVLWSVILSLLIMITPTSDSNALKFLMLLTFKYLALRMLGTSFFIMDATILIGFIILFMLTKSPLRSPMTINAVTSLIISIYASFNYF